MKRKAKFGAGAPQNLKRFKTEMNRLNKDHNSEWASKQSTGDTRVLVKQTKGPTRKQRRHEDRKLKKMRRMAFMQKKTLPTKDTLKNERITAEKAEKKKFLKALKRKKEKTRKKKLKEKEEETVNVRKQGLLLAIKQEDQNIKQLEKQLYMNKKKSKSLPMGFKNDGLDYLLNAVDSDQLQNMYETGGDLSDDDTPKASWDIEDDDEEDEDLSSGDDSDNSEKVSDDFESIDEPLPDLPDKSTVTGILKKKKAKSKEDNEDSKSVHFDEKKSKPFKQASASTIDPAAAQEDAISESPKKQNNKSKSKSKSKSKEVVKFHDDGSEGADIDNSDVPAAETSAESDLKEDIYGRLRDDQGEIVAQGAYVPPAKRLELAASSDAKRQQELERLKRLLKGLVNRLSESSMVNISTQIEALYRQHSRMELTEILVDMVIEACVSSTLTPERLTMEHVMLIAILHSNVATDIGAYMLQTLATMLDSERHKEQYGESKEADNLLILIANLYNFKVVNSLLIFDILRLLTESFGEKDIELLVLVLKTVGFSLRKDDAAALKEIIVLIQQKAASVDTKQFQDQSRVKFMIEVLMAIKNNNMRKIPNYDPSHLDHLRKMLRTYVREGSLPEHQLRISYSDLLDSQNKGRWWVVGSAWTGRDTVQTPIENAAVRGVGQMSGEILELARQQRMNTDIRKNIFCIIMTCEDFVDAFEKLLQLGLKNQQEREIIHVIMDLCLQEKTFNPFYAFLSQKFCEHDRRFQMTTQFTLWDKFKELQDYGEHKMRNLASYLAHLLATKAMSLSVFKVIEFGQLEKPQVRFMKRVFNILLLDQPDHVIRDVFQRIASLPKLQVLREGLKLFLRHFLLRGSKALEADTKARLEGLIDIAEKALSSADAQMLL